MKSIIYFILAVIISGCISVDRTRDVLSNDNSLIDFVQNSIDRGSSVMRAQLSSQECENYFETWLISTAEDRQYFGFAVAEAKGDIKGASVMGILNEPPSCLISWFPKTSWSTIRKVTFSNEFFDLMRSKGKPWPEGAVHADIRYVYLKLHGKAREMAYVEYSQEKTEAQKLAKEITGFVINQVDRQKILTDFRRDSRSTIQH